MPEGAGFLQFRLGAFEFAMDLSSVKEILRRSTPAKARSLPPFVEGIVTLRSMNIPVIDMRKRFAIEPSGNCSEIIIASIKRRIVGLCVDGVTEVGVVASSRVTLDESVDGAWAYCVDSVIETAQGRAVLIDAARLLSEDEAACLGEPVAMGLGV